MSQSKQKLQDFLAPLLSSEDKGIGASGDLAKTKDMRAYMYSLPTVAYLGESTHKTGDPMNEKMARLDNTLHIIDGHAERMFSGVAGRRYMVKQGSNVGFIPAAYVEGASGGAPPASPSASTTPSTPSTPSIPSTSSTPAAPVHEVALTSHKLSVNGLLLDSTEIYNIDGSNYFKLHTMAVLLSSTGSEFSVDYDAVRGVIVVKTGAMYKADGTEVLLRGGNSSTAAESSQSIEIDGKKVALDAFNIGGNNFLKLRDLGTALNFDVDYDSATATMIVRSG